MKTMEINIERFEASDALEAAEIWNEIVAEGKAFPQTEILNEKAALDFFLSQSFTGIARLENGEAAGLYILHPNNVGRCGHICNASYAVKEKFRGKHVGEALVRHCVKTAKELGFGILQFNAVVSTNIPALALYEKLGFKRLGTIPKGFRSDNGEFEDIIPHYIEL